MEIQASLATVQKLPPKPVYRMKEITKTLGSRATAYRTISALQKLGFAVPIKRGYLELRDSIFQPLRIWSDLLPSLEALKQARRFGRKYDQADINYARNNIQGFTTLDYGAFELTHFQIPRTLFVYVNDMEEAARKLKEDGFSEGAKGRVVLLPMANPTDANVQRLYLDSIAAGGRNLLDAIAIEILHGSELTVKGEFPVDLVEKVREDLPR
jgi:hypothetical protein